MYDYADGRKFNLPERLLFSAAARDERLARTFQAFGSRNIGPLRAMPTDDSPGDVRQRAPRAAPPR